MDFNDLDNILIPLTEHEKAYRDNPIVSNIYDMLPNITDNHGRKVYTFDDSALATTSNIKISKHSRYSIVPMHTHTFLELSYVYRGKLEEIINTKKVILSKDQIIIVDTEVPHFILPTSEEDIIINILIRKEYFSTSFLSRLSTKGIISEFLVNAISDKKTHDNYIIFNSETSRKIPSIIRELMCEYFDKSLCSEEIIDCYMILLFSELLRVFQYDSNKSQSYPSGRVSIIDILQYLEDNFMTCTLASTANHFNFHPNYLSALIKKTTNKSFKELIQAHKLTKASISLINSDVPIYEISNEIGYDNLSFFYKKFKNYFGITPNEYRDKFKNM